MWWRLRNRVARPAGPWNNVARRRGAGGCQGVEFRRQLAQGLAREQRRQRQREARLVAKAAVEAERQEGAPPQGGQVVVSPDLVDAEDIPADLDQALLRRGRRG